MLKKFKKDIFSKKIIPPEDKQLPLFFLSFFIVGLIAFLYHLQGSSAPTAAKEVFANADTYIPKGYTLIPIEVSNYESLDSIIGQFGVVDLFTTPLNPEDKARRIAYSVKILRAPQNPSHFAILTPQAEASKIASHNGAFIVTVKNPKEDGIQFVKEKPVERRRQVYYDLE